MGQLIGTRFDRCGARMRVDGVATGVEGLQKGRVVKGWLVCVVRMCVHFHSF